MPAEASALELMLAPLRALLDAEGVTDLHINRPGEVWIEDGQGVHRAACAFITEDWCYAIARLVANATRQHVSARQPLLSASLPGGERIQVVLQPAARFHALAIRRQALHSWSLAELEAMGTFAHCRWVRDHDYAEAAGAGQELDEAQRAMLALLAGGACRAFLEQAVAARCNILLSGATGSGKTTFGKALMRAIPAHERLIVIEDAPELDLARHPNHLRLTYSQGDQGQSEVTVQTLLVACLRLRPDRILLAELRKDEAWYYLDAVASGHPGAITSLHANGARLAFERLIGMIREGPGGAGLPLTDIRRLLHLLVDVVVHLERSEDAAGRLQRRVAEIWYDPLIRHRHAAPG